MIQSSSKDYRIHNFVINLKIYVKGQTPRKNITYTKTDTRNNKA